MLEKFDKIIKLGLFDDYTHSAGCEFGEATLVYGENGVGKTTLAAILDSLRERNPTELFRRKSLPGNIAPTVVVRLNGKDYSFDGHNWDDQPPFDTLDVFYSGFVTRNVYASTGVDSEHRRNLCELVLGRNAVEKVAKLVCADNEGRTALAEIKTIDRQLALLIKKPDTLETFLDLPNDPQIYEKSEIVRRNLKEAQSKDAILARIVPNQVPLPRIDSLAITQILEKCAESVAENVAEVVKTHIKEHLDCDGETWLAYGAKYIDANGECPFCAQDTSNSDLVASIRSYFSAEYRTFTESLEQDIQQIRNKLGSAVFAQISTVIAGQLAAAAQWIDVISIDQPMIVSILEEAEASWRSGSAKLGELVAKKKMTPLERIDASSADEAVAEYQRALGRLANVNSILATSANKAEERKANLSKADSAVIQRSLYHLENQKTRYEPFVQKLIAKRTELIEKRKKLEAKKTNLKREIEEYASKVVTKYQDGINHYLKYFGCDIRIESVKPRFPSGRASVQYKLKAHGHEIELGLSTTGPCFETVLSDGDKNTLALSFFFARLKEAESLTGRVVVLDDPVNSLGSSRRGLIEGVVRELLSRDAQVIVFTHDERLAAMMWRDKALKSIVPLHVERTRKGSRLRPWDVDRATQSEYVEDFLTLVNYLDNGGDHKKAAACIRPYLEQRLRHLFPGPPFQTRDNLGMMIGKIRVSTPSSRLNQLRAKMLELEAINDASLPSHHATDDVPGMQPLSPDEVRLYVQKALDVLG